MQVDELVFSARPRNSWSAIDLGFTLTRLWWRALILSWLIPALLLAALFSIVLYPFQEFAPLLVWWLKPLLDRFPLYIMSKRIFGDDCDLRACLSNWKSIVSVDIIPWLLWRRFNPMRSFVMPVTLLENLRGKRRDRRLNTLQLDGSGSAMWLTLICMHVEFILPLVITLTGLWILPGIEVSQTFEAFMEPDAVSLVLWNLVVILVMAVVAPFYIAAGFTLYLNRRIDLEGWDIEIAFRRLAARARVQGQTASFFSGLTLLMSVCCVGGLLAYPPAYAVDANTPLASAAVVPDSAEREQAKQQIKAVFEGDAFNETATIARWQRRGSEQDNTVEEIPAWLINFVEWVEQRWPDWTLPGGMNLRQWLAWFFRGIVIVFVLSVVIFVLVHYRVSLRRWFSAVPSQPTTAPEELFGMDVRQESLPENVPDQALALWHSGQRRASLALLYRASLSRLIHQHGYQFDSSLTERECMAMVSNSASTALSRYFMQMTVGWLRLAYAHEEPLQQWMLDLCARWESVMAHD